MGGWSWVFQYCPWDSTGGSVVVLWWSERLGTGGCQSMPVCLSGATQQCTLLPEPKANSRHMWESINKVPQLTTLF